MTTLYQQFNAACSSVVLKQILLLQVSLWLQKLDAISKSPRGGKTYVKTNPNRVHKASAAGESPATDLGFLVRSIQMQPDLDNLRVQVVSLATIAPYAKDWNLAIYLVVYNPDHLCLKAYKPKAKSD